MTLPARGLFLWENLVDREGVTLGASSENAAWPVENLADPLLDSPFRSASAASAVVITASFGESLAWQGLTLPHHNLREDATVAIEHATVDTPGGGDWISVQAAEDCRALDVWPNGGVPRNTYVYLADAAITSKHVRITVSDVDHPCGYLEFPRLSIGPVFQPAINFGYGCRRLVFDGTMVHPTPLGPERRSRGERRRGFAATWSRLTKAEADQLLEELLYALGRAGELLFVPNPSSPSTWRYEALWCRIEEADGDEEPYFQTHSVNATLKEVHP